MPSILRSRVALALMLGAFLIPVFTSSLRGLTHVLTCEGEVATPFSLVLRPNEEATVISAQRIERGTEDLGALCGGLSVDLAARTDPDGSVTMVVPITNHTEHPWQGTVLFRLGGGPIPIDIGRVAPKATATEEVRLRLDPGQRELEGTLLIGP